VEHPSFPWVSDALGFLWVGYTKGGYMSITKGVCITTTRSERPHESKEYDNLQCATLAGTCLHGLACVISPTILSLLLSSSCPPCPPSVPVAGGHRDDMERNLRHPVLSASLGCTAVFLLGGQGRDTEPLPLLLRSGDVMVLSGRVRTAMHGVARCFPGSAPTAIMSGGTPSICGFSPAFSCMSHSQDNVGSCRISSRYVEGVGGEPGPAAEEEAFAAWISGTRINFNLRQVL